MTKASTSILGTLLIQGTVRIDNEFSFLRYPNGTLILALNHDELNKALLSIEATLPEDLPRLALDPGEAPDISSISGGEAYLALGDYRDKLALSIIASSLLSSGAPQHVQSL